MTENVEKLLKEKFPGLNLKAEADERNIITLRGECETWEQLVEAGHTAASADGVKNVVSEMTVRGKKIPRKDYSADKKRGEAAGIIRQADVIIIGAGVTGCAVARSLAKYDLDIVVVEMSDDVCTGASKANNGNIHPGHAAKPGTLKAKLNVLGNRMYDQWAEELGFTLDRCGSMGVITDQRLWPALKASYDIAVLNGVDGAELIDEARAYELEPNLKKRNISVCGGIWLPSMGLVEPYEVVVALAENAAENGVEFMFHTTVADVLKEKGQVSAVVTSKGIIKADYVINCAGVYADEISAMAGDKCYTIHGRKGTIAILDKNRAPEFSALTLIIDGKEVQSKKKNKESKGGGMCRTPEWNVLLGPSATETPDKEDNTTTAEDLAYAMATNQDSEITEADIIRIFAGVRPADFKEDFVIEMSPVTHGFINVGAIQSPGLASAPAIGAMVENIFKEDYEKHKALSLKASFNPCRAKKIEFRHMTREAQAELIQKDSRYGKIICRCETITEGEILDAICSPVVPASVDAIKRRTRAGMGRCQGGFCQPKVVEILARELGKDKTEIYLKDGESRILYKDNRDCENKEGEV